MKRFYHLLSNALGIGCLILALPVLSEASLVPILDITQATVGPLPAGDAVGGWQFHVANPITLSALGLWDEADSPLAIAHKVGLWTIGGTLLTTATVDNTSTPVSSVSAAGQWLFADIAPITLAAGDYVLGAVWGDPGIGADPFVSSTAAPLTTGVTFSGQRLTTLVNGPVLVFPNGPPGGNSLFGPNAAFSVPEPASALLLFAGSILYVSRRMHRRRAS